MELVRSAFAPVPILTAPYFEQEVIGPAMLDRLGDEVFAEQRRRQPCCTTTWRRSSSSENGTRDAAAADPVRRARATSS